MSAGASTLFFWSDWLGDQEVRRLTPAERGVWIDLLALAAAASPVGYVCDGKGRQLTMEEIARVTGETPEVVSNLIAGILEKGAASRDRTGRLFNRRMVRDAAIRLKRSEGGRRGGKSTANKHWGKAHLLQPMLRPGLQQDCYTPFPSKKEIESLSTEPRASVAPQQKNNEAEEASKQVPFDKGSGVSPALVASVRARGWVR